MSELSTNNQMANFYRKQLEKFDKIGLGNKTEYDVVVTPALIETTRKRLAQLTIYRRFRNGK